MLLFTSVVVVLISIDDTNALSLGSTQFVGSKVSLISKSDIRYEGTLYAMDVIEATISLAKVRSFGTEDRPTNRPIPMSDEIYEFIVFKGSDIQSIDVLAPPNTEGLNDHAEIML